MPSSGNIIDTVHDKKVAIPASGRGNVGGGARGSRDICPPPPEHHFSVYHDSSDTGAISGSRTASGSTGLMMVVGSGQNRPWPRVGGVSVSGQAVEAEIYEGVER